jgi:4-diphosphocytidyl-2-C-methyl-D-erythritol kinase
MPPSLRAPLCVFSCAKINLSLDILARRGDGYHELRSVVHTVALCDTLRFAFDQSGSWRLCCDDALLEGDSNLCLRAARAWTEAAQSNGFPPGAGGQITLEKRIPYGAGLGGGSGNAWATLAALSRALDRDGKYLPAPEAMALAKTLGADVPLFARGGAQVLEGIGERISPLPPLRGWVVLAQPRERISTPQAYGAWDATGSTSGHASATLLQAWKNSGARLEDVARCLGNDMRAGATALGVPVHTGIEALLHAGALGAEMTGSGSAVFGLCRDEAHAQQVRGHANALLNAGVGQIDGVAWRLWSAPLCSYGLRWTEESPEEERQVLRRSVGRFGKEEDGQ